MQNPKSDNHITAAGGVLKAIETIREKMTNTIKIEVEVKDFDELNQALDGGSDIIMLDNMNPDIMKKAVSIIRKKGKKTLIEASGNVTLDTLKNICKTGVDIVSVGAITHSAPALDFSLKFD